MFVARSTGVYDDRIEPHRGTWSYVIRPIATQAYAIDLITLRAEYFMKWVLFFKLIGITVFATIARFLYANEKPTILEIIGRIIIGGFLTTISFLIAREWFHLTDNTSVAISGLVTFAYRETIDFILKVDLSDFFGRKK